MNTQEPIVTVKHERLHALDALRAFAMMLGVWLHMAMPYTEGLPIGFWTADEQDSGLVSLSVLLIHSWRMELFFMLSGFFTAMLVVRRGVRATGAQRAKRIVLPFVIVMVTIQPLCAILWGLGYADLFGGSVSYWIKAWLGSSWGIESSSIPLAFGRLWHFWFLYVLIYLISTALIAHAILPKAFAWFWDGASAFVAWGVRSFIGPFALAILLGLMLIGLNAPNGPDPMPSLNPVFGTIAYYALPFFAGWFLYPRREAIDILAKRFWWCLTIGLAVALPVHIMSLMKAVPDLIETPGMLTTPIIVACMSRGLLTVTLSLGLTGLCALLLTAPGPRLARAIRYFSDSAYWVYLMHLPLVAAMSIWLFKPMDLPAEIEMILGVTIAMFLLMGSYALFVRYTPIGTLLNGKRTRNAPTITTASAPAAAGASAHPASPPPREAAPPRSS